MKVHRIESSTEEFRVFHCPGCNTSHMVKTSAGGWGFNGNEELPAFTPSILVTRPPDPSYRCHSYVTDGRIQFLNDCSHSLVGQTVELPEWDDDTM